MTSCGRYCRTLRDAGYDIFAFDFRGHGRSEAEPDYSPRQWITNHDMNDIRGALAYISRWLSEQGYSTDVGLFGISRGACAAILAAAEFDNVRVVISDGGFSTDTTIEYFMRRWADIFANIRLMQLDAHPPAFWRWLRRVFMVFAHVEFRCRFPSVRKAIHQMRPRPMLFIHGEKDSYLPVEQSRKLYAVAPQPKYLWVAPGARHNQAVDLHPDLYAKLTTWFVDRYLAGAPCPELWYTPEPAASQRETTSNHAAADAPSSTTAI
jgi:pimeloyl-ACP methyl ester carboxylesterase